MRFALAILLVSCASASTSDDMLSAKSICLVADEHNARDQYVRAASEIRPKGVELKLGESVGRCAADLYFVRDSGRNLAFRMNGSEREVFVENDEPPYQFAVTQLMRFVMKNGPEER